MKSFEIHYKEQKKRNGHNATTLSKEFNWLASFIKSQMDLYFSESEDIARPNAKNLNEDHSTYAEFIKYYNFNEEERIVLLMAIAPHVCPQLLDCFFVKNSTYARYFTEFGGVKGNNHLGFLPTGETAVFVIALGNLLKRFDVMQYFSTDHYFFKHKIIRLEKENSTEPHLSGRLVISKEFLAILTEDKRYNPTYSSEFPASKLDTTLSWEDLVLEENIIQQIQEIQTWITHENDIIEDEVLSKFIKPGYRSLFYGPPGTGKTLTASLLGKYTGLDVFRIDLSKVVSKYIGETEKNLANIFDQGENKNWILFFDEADALFGKRTSLSDSKDRYANQEIAYLLQRMEDYSGVIILATNLKTNMDEAFARRFQSMIYFPMPRPEQRLYLWNKMFSTMPLDHDIDLKKIAHTYELSGGSIINILRYCALQSLSRKEQLVFHDDIILGIQKELFKEGKTL